MSDVIISSFKNKSLYVGSHNSDAGNRDVMIAAAKEIFGDGAVIPVSNFNTLKLKSLVADISKYYEVPLEEVRAVTNLLQEEVMPHAKDENTEKSVFVLTHDDCMKYSSRYKTFMGKYPDICEHIKILFMQNKSCFTANMGVLTSEGYKSVLDIQVSDAVAFIDKNSNVKFNNDYEVIFQGAKDVFLVELEDDTVLELTGDHQVLTDRGYVEVQQLRETDLILGV